jgi:hypothetical protein
LKIEKENVLNFIEGLDHQKLSYRQFFSNFLLPFFRRLRIFAADATLTTGLAVVFLGYSWKQITTLLI